MQITPTDVNRLADFVQSNPRLVVLTGAGISVDSGIPAYRDTAGRWQSAQPILANDFRQSRHTRQRYWARSYSGWPTVRDAEPNAAHRALAAMEQIGHVHLLVTQNVDGLHEKAGSQKVIDLHGRVDRVVCMNCEATFERELIQRSLAAQHTGPDQSGQRVRPDGDSDIAPEQISSFAEPLCFDCGGTLTPAVVFFGGNIPRERVEQCRLGVEQADALLVAGSSLQVFSGYRMCRQAANAGKPIALINPGNSRADELARLKLRSAAGPLLAAVNEKLRLTANTGRSTAPPDH